MLLAKRTNAYLRVGELARIAGKTVRAMRFYEELGLLQPALRSEGGYRLYHPEAALRAHWIAKMQEMGFSLPEIQDMLKEWEHAENGPRGMEKIRAIFAERLKGTRRQLLKLRTLERELRESLDYLDQCMGCEPSREVKECACCGYQGHDPAHTPDLVAGLAKPVRRWDVALKHLAEGIR